MMTETTFLQTVQRNEQRLFRYAMRFMKDVSTAEDAVQELVVKLWKKRNKLEKYDNMDAMMMTAMKNHCLDEIKKRKRRRDHYQNHMSSQNQASVNPAKTLEHQNNFSHVKELIDELPDTQKMVIQLRDIEQMEMDEIEAITGMSSGAIRTNLSRARKQIRQMMKKLHSYGME